MALFVGTSGWAYKEWKPDFYPEDLPQRSFLGHYGSVLDACEINATFYRLQKDDTFKKWAEETPDDFRFATKVHRKLTHSKKIAPDDDSREFFHAYLKSVGTLGDRLGVVLFQFPPYRKLDLEQFDLLLDSLPSDRKYAFEFRDESWNAPEVGDRIAERGHALCFSNTDGQVPSSLPPGGLGYVRLRTDRYTEAGRSGWLDLLQREAADRDVYVFTKHEGIPAGDPYGGIGLAQWLVAHR